MLKCCPSFSSPAFSRPCDSLRSCPSFSSPAFSGRAFSVAPKHTLVASVHQYLQLCTCLSPVRTTTTTHTQPFNGRWSGTTRFTHSHQSWSSDILYHLLWSTASSVFSLRASQSSLTTSLQVLFGLPLDLGPSTLYSMHFFTQSSSFCSTCPYQPSLFCCNTNAMSS